MPQMNTSDVVKQQVETLLQRLLAYANHELPDYDYLRNKLVVRWIDPGKGRPQLIVQTELRFLTELVFGQQSNHFKEILKQDLYVLKQFLEILEDHRTKTQGSAQWHFTLKLWHRTAAENLHEFRSEWEHRKSLKSIKSTLKSPKLSQTLSIESSIQPPAQGNGSVLRTSIQSRESTELNSFTQNDSEQSTPLHHNLPACDYTTFIGRSLHLARLLELLSMSNSAFRIGVEGIGGVGKTSLVLEAAYHCLQHRAHTNKLQNTPDFKAIIYTSAKPQHLTTRGILPRFRTEQTLSQIFRAIAYTLGYPDILSCNFEHQFDQIQRILARQQTLLILDSFEMVDTPQEVLSFLYDLPSMVKVVVTSCEQAIVDFSLRLDPLPAAEGIQFIQHQASTKAVPISDEKAQLLYQKTGGIPAAIVYAIGQLANGYRVQDVLPRLTLAEGDFCRFYFERSVNPLRGERSHQILMALAMFPKPALSEAIIQIICPAESCESALRDSFAELCRLSLLILQAGRYTMLPLTRDYALTELRANPVFEQSARAGWVNWYIQYVQQYGTKAWREWHDYRAFNQEWDNIQAAIEWCIEQERYEEFNQFWQYVKGYTHLYGYWHERLIWMEWLLQIAQQHTDTAVVVEALRDRSWTLTLMGKPEQLTEAETLLNQAWQLCHRANPEVQLELAIDWAILSIHQQRFELTYHWLQQAKDCLQQAQSQIESQTMSQLPAQIQSQEAGQVSPDTTRFLQALIRIHYYEAEIWYRRGNYDQARVLYEDVLEKVDIVQWEQVKVYTLNWLTDIALQQGSLKEAETFLLQGLPLAEQYQDQRSIAFYQRSWAWLEKLKANPSQLRNRASQAKTYFEKLGMEQEVKEMESWLTETL